MKRIFLIIIGLCLCTAIYADMNPYIIGVPTEAESFCSGSELFCADFETDGMITWDTTPGAEDCDVYDADGDWCDYESIIYKNGSHAVGIRGTNTVKLIENLSTTTNEFYVDYWFRMTDTTSTYGFNIYDVDGAWYQIAQYQDADGSLKIYWSNGAGNLDSGYVCSPDTWYHVRVYYKEETSTQKNDGILRCWITTDAEFAGDDSDRYINNEACDNGLGIDAGEIQFAGPVTGQTSYWDDVKVINGAP